jgi:hypothetical protein
LNPLRPLNHQIFQRKIIHNTIHNYPQLIHKNSTDLSTSFFLALTATGKQGDLGKTGTHKFVDLTGKSELSTVFSTGLGELVDNRETTRAFNLKRHPHFVPIKTAVILAGF